MRTIFKSKNAHTYNPWSSPFMMLLSLFLSIILIDSHYWWQNIASERLFGCNLCNERKYKCNTNECYHWEHVLVKTNERFGRPPFFNKRAAYSHGSRAGPHPSYMIGKTVACGRSDERVVLVKRWQWILAIQNRYIWYHQQYFIIF